MMVTTFLRTTKFCHRCRHIKLRVNFRIIVMRRHERGFPQRYRQRLDGAMELILPRRNFVFIRRYKVWIRK
jgi:hypothetical protein